jgi:hypothetical protein
MLQAAHTPPRPPTPFELATGQVLNRRSSHSPSPKAASLQFTGLFTSSDSRRRFWNQTDVSASAWNSGDFLRRDNWRRWG